MFRGMIIPCLGLCDKETHVEPTRRPLSGYNCKLQSPFCAGHLEPSIHLTAFCILNLVVLRNLSLLEILLSLSRGLKQMEGTNDGTARDTGVREYFLGATHRKPTAKAVLALSLKRLPRFVLFNHRFQKPVVFPGFPRFSRKKDPWVQNGNGRYPMESQLRACPSLFPRGSEELHRAMMLVTPDEEMHRVQSEGQAHGCGGFPPSESNEAFASA